MRILPVLDLMHGQVVRGVAGKREHYQPIRSPLAASATPLAVARAFREHFQLIELYLADLDAIAGSLPAIEVFLTLQSEGFKLLVDAGLRCAADAAPLLTAGVSAIVAGLETVLEPLALEEIVKQVGSDLLVFSLDLKNGQPLTTSAAWGTTTPFGIASKAIGLGVRRLLILDLARVGVGTGTGTESLCAQLKQMYPNIELLAGGGVRGGQDLERLRQCGVDCALVASALHDGQLKREDWI
ncbi:MAG TPA: HisA/HisF-related TIM barrel protein [Gemmataceae bacterium]|nr:HisA/HisF-related TIM barrel protein [Gemmataceae bacterium]